VNESLVFIDILSSGFGLKIGFVPQTRRENTTKRCIFLAQGAPRA